MRRILATTFAIAFSLFMAHDSKAQDIIHTFDSAPVAAKILEIGDDYMMYKTWDNLDGPLYNISLSRVVKVVFENGTTQHFGSSSPHIYPESFGRHSLDYRYGNYYTPYGRISREDMMDYIGYSLYGSEYMRARSQFTWGMMLTFTGIGGLLITTVANIAYAEMNEMRESHDMQGYGDAGRQVGLAVGYIASAGCIGAGIPLWVKGNRGLRKIADDYNRTYVNPGYGDRGASLSIGTTANGFGLAFNF
jgi:hypothetical protein